MITQYYNTRLLSFHLDSFLQHQSLLWAGRHTRLTFTDGNRYPDYASQVDNREQSKRQQEKQWCDSWSDRGATAGLLIQLDRAMDSGTIIQCWNRRLLSFHLDCFYNVEHCYEQEDTCAWQSLMETVTLIIPLKARIVNNPSNIWSNCGVTAEVPVEQQQECW